MKILRLSLFMLIAMMLVPTGVSAHCKGKHTGEHEHCGGGGGEDPPANPAFAIAGDGASTGSVFLMNVDGSNYESIFNRKTARGLSVWDVKWSPDGNRITYDERYNEPIYTVNVDGTDVKEINPTFNNVAIVAGDFEWRRVDALNSSRIFFIGGDPNDGRTLFWDVYVIDPEGSSQQEAILLTSGDPTDYVRDFAVSVDGTQMVVRYYGDAQKWSDRDSELVWFQLSVVDGSIVATEIGNIIPNGFTGLDDPSPGPWANENNWLLLIDQNQLFVIDMASWTVTPLLGGSAPINPGCVRSPTWSPADIQIAFDVQCFGNQPKNEGIHIVDFTGPSAQAPYVDNLVQVTTGLGRIKLDWRPTWTP